MKAWDIFFALVISLGLMFGLTVLYVFYPLISVWVREAFSNQPHYDVMFAVGGVKSKGLIALVLIEPILFLLTLALLERRHKRS